MWWRFKLSVCFNHSACRTVFQTPSLDTFPTAGVSFRKWEARPLRAVTGQLCGCEKVSRIWIISRALFFFSCFTLFLYTNKCNTMNAFEERFSQSVWSFLWWQFFHPYNFSLRHGRTTRCNFRYTPAFSLWCDMLIFCAFWSWQRGEGQLYWSRNEANFITNKDVCNGA